MVQTRAATKRIESGQALETVVVPPPVKKRRVDDAGSTKNHHRGEPGELCQLNLDVLFLLAAYIHPLDFLNLARTCKSLRELLMDKSSAFIWKTARRHVEPAGLPDCPADLTEPEYANLAFYARCHACGKHAKMIFWGLRRRYCADCRRQRLCNISSCPDIIRSNYVLPVESLTIAGEKGEWADKDKRKSFLQEYGDASDKEHFLSEKRSQCHDIHQHADMCRCWDWEVASKHRCDLDSRRQAREQSIFERLKQHGYEPEIAYFGRYAIHQSRKSFFRTSKPLIDIEWSWMWPEWLVTMNDFRSRRMENAVYKPRRDLLKSEYDRYVASPASNTLAFDLLPDAMELSYFLPFRDIIKAPEGTEMGVKPFESAFAQLPAFVEEWRMQLEGQLAELVEVPSRLCSQDSSGGRCGASSSATRTESSKTPADKLRLACAVFKHDGFIAFYPEILFLVFPATKPIRDEGNLEETVSTRDRFGIEFLEEAPCIVHACGLDPNVATTEDLDRRNARLKCLTCKDSWVRNWRNAVWHVFLMHDRRPMSSFKSPRFETVSDEYIDAIQAAELSSSGPPTPYTRCLLCCPSVGDAMYHGVKWHLIERHGMDEDAIREGVHYTPVSMRVTHWGARSQVRMVEEGEEVTFI